MIRFGSVCSGIEAASVAWNPLGWKAAWVAEIEPFPSAVLHYHYADVDNLGDMTTLPDRIRSGEVEAPDLFCGGTPCQAFSVAGLRKSLSDQRGNLSLVFCEIADAIDESRSVRGLPPAVVFWENVPGVLSTSDNAFGCFLAQLCGGDEPLAAPDGWPDAGFVSGPKRAAAWRVLDAQYFGLAQRRRRVFVVASARAGFDPAAVLFEFDGVRRDTAPSREAGQRVAPTIAGCANGGGANGPGRDVDSCESLIPSVSNALRAASGGVDREDGHTLITASGRGVERTKESRGQDPLVAVIAPELARCVATREGSSQDWETTTMVAHALRAEGFDASEDGTGRGTPLVPVGVTIHGTDPTVQKVASYDDLAQCLRARTPGNIDNSSTTVIQQPIPFDPKQIAHPANFSNPQPGDVCHPLRAVANCEPAVVLPFDPAQITSPGNRSNPQAGDPCHTLHARASESPIIAFSGKDYGADATEDLAPTLRAMPHDGSPANGGGQMAVAFDWQGAGNQTTLGASEHATGALGATKTPAVCASMATPAMQVRRLTPVECERLMGFPDRYTAIPWRGKPASECPDGPRYKALGNSWAVPVVRWIGQRIHNAIAGGDQCN